MPRILPVLLLMIALPVSAEPLYQDHERNIHVPDQQGEPEILRVGAVYNERQFRLYYEFEVDQPSWYHQYWRREGDEWVAYGSGAPGPGPHHLYEDRISMMLDDGSVEGFDRYGGWMLVHEGMRTLSSGVSSDKVKEHEKLGREMGRSDVRKYLPGTRDADAGETSWDRLMPDDELEALRDDGYFLDLWQWRAHRSHPMGHADNTLVAHYRLSSEGRSMFVHNRNEDGDGPAYMFDPDKTGRHALDWDKLIAREYGQEDDYYLSEDRAVAYDPEHDWREGDVLPRRLLRQPDGSRGAITASGNYRDGAWRIVLTRELDAPDARDSKNLEHGKTYNVAFAVHSGGVGARWHRVSLPQTLGLGVDGVDIPATRVKDLDKAEPDWVEIPLIYPGQVTWQWLNSDHPGARMVREGELGVRDQHALEELMEFIVNNELKRFR